MTTTIRLTNSARDAFVEACMCDVPKPDYAALVKEAQDILYKLMSPPVRKVFRESPEALRYETFTTLADRGYAKLIVADVRPKDALEPILYKAQARDRVRSTIRAIAYKCSTSKQLEEALPEFAHHVPRADKPTSNLPVPASFTNDLKVLGFEPKVQKVEEQ
jgi:hypothetical protein